MLGFYLVNHTCFGEEVMWRSGRILCVVSIFSSRIAETPIKFESDVIFLNPVSWLRDSIDLAPLLLIWFNFNLNVDK